MTAYTLVCPNALVNKNRGLSITTSFTYSTLEEARKHKKACDEWDIDKGEAPKSYIIIEEDEDRHVQEQAFENILEERGQLKLIQE